MLGNSAACASALGAVVAVGLAAAGSADITTNDIQIHLRLGNWYAPLCTDGVPVELSCLGIVIVTHNILLLIADNVRFAAMHVGALAANPQGITIPVVRDILAVFVLHTLELKLGCVAVVLFNKTPLNAVVAIGGGEQGGDCFGRFQLGMLVGPAFQAHTHMVVSNGKIIARCLRW